MTVAFVYPGQGHQPGPLRADLPDDDAVNVTLAEADSLLPKGLAGLGSELTAEAIVSSQLGLVVRAVAATRALAAEGATPNLVAGHSVGAFGAAVVAGALEFSEAIRLVTRRAEMMAELFPSGYGVLAVFGLTRPELDRLITESADGQEPVWIANVNSFDQMVVTGTNAALQQVGDLAGRRGARTERLQVAVPSHAPILEPVTRELRSLLRLVPGRRLVASYITISSARRAHDASEVLEDLAVSVSQTVLWRDAFGVITELGADLVVEVAPGHTLVGLARSIGNSVPQNDLRLVAMGETRFADCVRLIRQSNNPRQNKA